jgi:hypothetical protein
MMRASAPRPSSVRGPLTGSNSLVVAVAASWLGLLLTERPSLIVNSLVAKTTVIASQRRGALWS